MIRVQILYTKNSLLGMLVLVIALSLLGAGCAGKSSRSGGRWKPETSQKSVQKPVTVKPAPRKIPDPPENVRILVTIRNWEIHDHRLLNWSREYGQLRFSGRFLMNDNLAYYKFEIDGKFKYYWLVNIPEKKQGQFTMTAKRYSNQSMVTPLPNPPENFVLFIKVKNKMIIQDFVVDHNPEWGMFEFDRVKNGLLYMKNKWYPGSQWAAVLPKTDGDWTLHVRLLSNKK